MITQALSEIPASMRPQFVGSFNTMYKKGLLRKNKQSNNSFGVHRGGSDFMRLPDGSSDEVYGFVGYNPRMLKREEKLKAEWNSKGLVSYNTSKKATIHHELGHVIADKIGISDSFVKLANKWYAEQPYMSIKPRNDSEFGGRNNGYGEAFAEGYAAYKTGNKNLPRYIKEFYSNLF